MKQLRKKYCRELWAEIKIKELYLLRNDRSLNGNLDREAASHGTGNFCGLQRGNSQGQLGGRKSGEHLRYRSQSNFFFRVTF